VFIIISLSCEALAEWDKIIRIMKKIFKGLGLGLIALALVVVGGVQANATLTIADLAATSSGALTISSSSDAAGVITLGTVASTSAINVGITTTGTTSTVNIMSGNGVSSTQTVTIGGGTSTTGGGKVVNIATGIAGTATTNTVNIATANSVGVETVNIGSGLTTGAGGKTVNIGDGANTTGVVTVNVGTGATTLAGGKIINIGTTAPTGSGQVKVNIGAASVVAGSGVRIGASRVTVNKPVTSVVLGDTAGTPTVTQILDAGIFTVAPSVDRAFTLPAVQGASGLVQALPGTPAVGDVFSFVVANMAATTSGFDVTLAASASPTGYTLGSLGIAVPGSTTTFYCRVTGVGAGAETITCY
jgi:hypothetical protein